MVQSEQGWVYLPLLWSRLTNLLFDAVDIDWARACSVVYFLFSVLRGDYQQVRVLRSPQRWLLRSSHAQTALG